MNLPAFITFTGADDQTSIDGMLELSALYPIEWGILFSPSRQGIEPRYPSMSTIYGFADVPDLAAHLCGGYSRELLSTGQVAGIEGLLVAAFRRVQVNTSDPAVMQKTRAIGQWAARLGVKAIVQCRDFFPVDEAVGWLFDASGGRGVSPKAWPNDYASDGTELRGYAGGLGPDNVRAAVDDISSKCASYYLDMESGVRDENDRFDLNRCRAVCETVYGVRQ